MRSYPALALLWHAPPTEAAVEQVLAVIDDDHPTALDGDGAGRRVYFGSSDDRDRACGRLAHAAPAIAVRSIDVPDDDWAERNQAALRPVTVGRFVVTPPWHAADAKLAEDTDQVLIIIRPAMGFGTGHHASTRLCLRLLQKIPVDGRAALDVGTGSGVLALAAWLLGAGPVDALDPDPDALDSARDNLALNGATGAVRLRHDALTAADAAGSGYEVILANLTGDLLCRCAPALTALARPGAHLIISGFEAGDGDDVVTVLAGEGWAFVSSADEDGWRGAVLQASPTNPTAPRAS